MNNNQIIRYERLFRKFNRVEKSEEVLPTFMEISGYPHFENVASNILAYYLDTKQSHKLGDLLIRSLLDCLVDLYTEKHEIQLFNEELELETIYVYREKVIENKKRIDLIVECDNFCISIENKLFHHLNNDLTVYQKAINDRFKDKNSYHIVLSLKPEIVSGTFVNLTYEHFFLKVKNNIGDYLLKAPQKSVIYLLDFIQTIERFYKVEVINKDMFQFIIEHSQDLKEIEQEKEKLKQALVRVIGKIQQKVECCNNNYKTWVYKKYVLVYDFSFDNRLIAVDIVFDFNEVTMTLAARNNKGISIIKDLALIQNNVLSKSGNHHIIFNKKINFFEIDLDQFSKEISGYLDQIYISE
ncbi:PD-(D/E)XK nuclease family protein [Sphingobacterium lactis]|uniref:PD-(D/E)XK nuclease family protein n=1 Tax=Sphingobacterium lactis TaxID=797291 RepID=UPI003DA5C407